MVRAAQIKILKVLMTSYEIKSITEFTRHE